MVKIVYIPSLKSYVAKIGERFFTVLIDMDKFNDYNLQIDNKKFLSCVGSVEYLQGRTVTIPMIKLLIEKKDGTKVSDRTLYRLSFSEESFDELIDNGLVSLLEIYVTETIGYSDLWKFEDEIIVTSGIGENLSVIGIGEDGRKTSEGFISFENCRTPQIFKYSDKVVIIDKHGKDLCILVDGIVVETTRMTVSSIYNNKYLNFK
jgi:hypothetical protein